MQVSLYYVLLTYFYVLLTFCYVLLTFCSMYHNPDTLEGYKDKKKKMIRRFERESDAFKISRSVKPYLKNAISGARDFLPEGEPYMDERVNEVWLFHGTRKSNIKSIRDEGFDLDLADDDALYGSWIYLSDSPQKADQYAGTDGRANDGMKER